MLLLHHTTAKCDNRVGVRKLVLLECADVSENSVLGVLSYGTGVEDNQICLCSLLTKSISHFTEHTLDTLAVGYILLTTVGNYVGERLAAVSGLQKIIHFLGILILLLQLRLGNPFNLNCHRYTYPY